MIDKYVKVTYKIKLDRIAKKLPKYPNHIIKNLFEWVRSIEKSGLRTTQLVPGYRDKPLSGKRYGQRSVRLSKSYRLFYSIDEENLIIEVLEVNKHDY